MVMGSLPRLYRGYFDLFFKESFLIYSHAQINVLALENCCEASNRSVYLMTTAVPPASRKFGHSTLKNRKRARTKYGSSFSSTVGNQVKMNQFLFVFLFFRFVL